MHIVAVVCASLGNFANGNITYVNDTIPDHDFATIATYTCNDGYRLRADYSVVESLVRTCAKLYSWRSTGFWSPNPRYHQPYCECMSSAYTVTIYFQLEYNNNNNIVCQ